MDAQVFYRMTGPTEWPSPPAYYSFSSLAVLQECPRRWQLSHGQYGDLNRLPEAPSEAAEVGHIVHEVLSRLMVALAQRGLPALGSKAFQEAMKAIDLRGLVQQRIDNIHTKIEGHPRAAAARWHLTLGDVLNRVLHQFHLTYPTVQAGKTTKVFPLTSTKGAPTENKNLASKLTAKGLLSEEEVRHATLRLRGFIDLVHATQTGPVILDFKTGAQHDEHRNQLELYAVLWWSSTGQIPSALVLRYADREDRWTIDEAKLLQLESAYRNLLDKLDATLSEKPADAHPGPHCRRCPGRPFCDPYWTTGPAGVDPLSAAEGTWLDVEGKLLAVGEGAAQVTIQGKQVTLMLQEPALLRAAIGSTLRLLGVRRGPSESLQLGERSEVFFVTPFLRARRINDEFAAKAPPSFQEQRGVSLASASVTMASADQLTLDVGKMIEAARTQVAQAANAALTMLYWQIGARIHQDILLQQRAEYGAELVVALGQKLEASFGRGFGEKNLRRMVQFAEIFPDSEIVAALRRQLGWAHFKMLIPLKDPLKREFYAEMCRVEGWSTRTLEQKINSMLYERTALSKKPEELIRAEIAALREGDKLTPDLVFQDPYLLDFLGLRDTFSEKDLEAALLREIERFLLELGSGFAFVERQKRITLDGDDYYIDLLFFHRKLRRLVVIELKIGDFKPADAGQVELYLRWLDRHERQPWEEPPVGLILCAGKKRETVEYLDLGGRGIHVAEYLTELPPREVLEKRLHEALAAARTRLAQREP